MADKPDFSTTGTAETELGLAVGHYFHGLRPGYATNPEEALRLLAGLAVITSTALRELADTHYPAPARPTRGSRKTDLDAGIHRATIHHALETAHTLARLLHREVGTAMRESTKLPSTAAPEIAASEDGQLLMEAAERLRESVAAMDKRYAAQPWDDTVRRNQNNLLNLLANEAHQAGVRHLLDGTIEFRKGAKLAGLAERIEFVVRTLAGLENGDTVYRAHTNKASKVDQLKDDIHGALAEAGTEGLSAEDLSTSTGISGGSTYGVLSILLGEGGIVRQANGNYTDSALDTPKA
ncbi:hypothetical protein ACFVVA_40205 [Kitasatospora sp. NPDC058048]|uniref:hypothetical protein n=1 Tax=Kitasatospora sp. NPDC058048 TaxID=3346313 RepID=UPI0036DDEAE0